MVTYRATLDVPREAVLFVSKLLAAERCRRRTPRNSRALTCFQEAVLVLRHYRDGTAPAACRRWPTWVMQGSAPGTRR